MPSTRAPRLSALLACAALATGCNAGGGLVYPAPDHPAPPMPAAFERVDACARDGAPVHAYLLPPPDATAPVVVVFHGNGETMENRAGLATDLRGRGYGVALVEYRGYGLSSGGPPPDERGLYRDAAAVLEALAVRGYRSRRVVLMGISLGTAVAAQLATCGAGRALVLVSPFTSLLDEAHEIVPWLPASWFLKDRFDTLGKAPRIAMPTLVVHGTEDEIVPFAMGQRVAAAIPGARFFAVEGGHHNDVMRLWRRQVLDELDRLVR